MKKLLCLLLVGCLCIALAACDNDKVDGVEQIESSRFEKVDDDGYMFGNYKWDVYVDYKTNNIYLSRSSESSSGVCPLYNEEGNIMKLDEYLRTR